MRSGLDLAQLVCADPITHILEDGDTGDVGQGLREELEPFATHLWGHEGQPR